MIGTIFLSVVGVILTLLGAAEVIHCHRQKVTGWEKAYYSRRLLRRLLGLGMLLLIVLSNLFVRPHRQYFFSPLWQMGYIGANFLLILSVFILLIKDIMDTARYALRKHSEITASSLKELHKELKDIMKEKEKEPPR
jgi:drug/metabolite transporter (DMT)-like permease